MTEQSLPNPPPFSSSYRASGLLLYVTCLPSPSYRDVVPIAIAYIDLVNL